MRRVLFFIAIFLFTLSSVMGQMIPINLPADGNWPTIVGDSIMIIGPRQNELTEEQRYFNPIYLMTYPGKEHLKAQMIRAGACDCDPTIPNRRIGVFSVAPDKKVSFSQGNLQYLPAINLWKFADTQYEYLGNANKYLKPTFRNWVDLFGWSANNTTAPFGVSTSTNVADYAGDFVDWGENTICGEAPGTWRTLSADEWKYLFEQRKNALQLRSKGSVNGHRGHILLPDDWVLPEGVQFVAEPDNLTMELDINTYTPAEWSIMEEAGAVFLPAAGRRDGTTVGYLVEYSGVWSSTSTTNTDAFHTYYNYESQIIEHHWTSATSRINGRSVRLVHDTVMPRTIPDPCLVVKVNDTLSINMMCVEGGTFTMGDGENAHPVSLSSYSIGQTEVTQALWEAVMGTNPSANTTNKQLPVTNISWYDCQEFIKKLNQQTGMRFRMPTEAEWEYAARGGQRSKGYTYAGSNDINDVAWYNGNSGNATHAVAQKKPNELGIYDMSGNVWEWCHDWCAPYRTTHQYNPLGPEVGHIVGTRHLRIFRGGSYGYAATYHQNTFRDITGPEPNIGTANLGLRLVLSDDVNFQTIHVNDTLSFHMMDVNGGAFMMGDDNTSNASPAHQVTLSDYYIGQTEVTQTLWKAVMGNIPTGNKNPSYPVGYVTYADCQNFIAKLNNLTGLHFQLPTEAEWEYAAMGGNKSHGYIYSGSNTIDDVAWYDQNSENKMHNVGAKQPNELGIYDMSGNAWEWCADYYDKYTADPKNDPKGPTTGTGRVIRSGSFRTTAERCSNKHRQAREADYPDSHITFRLVLHDTIVPEPPKRIAVFSVAADKQVSFSQGNLQYVQSTDTWQFAKEQYELIGEDYTTLGIWDLFGWSGKDNNAPFGVSESANVVDYRGEFVDWGKNRIGNDAPATWRTLSRDEWQYLIEIRPKADELYGVAMVAGVQGMILLPDDWVCPEGIIFNHGCHAKDNVENFAKHQTFSQEQWSIMEEAGAIFLPAAGIIYPPSKTITSVAGGAHYYSSDQKDADNAIFFGFRSSYYTINSSANRIRRSVRLVHDTIVQKVEPEAVNLGLSVKWATFNVGATSPEDYGDYFAWGETEPKETYSWATYKWCDGTQNTMTKYNATDGKTILEPADDAAQVHWGGKWRMPSKEEVDELTQQCNWIWTTHNNVNGYKVTGPNGNSIFLPAAGYKGAGPTYPAGEDGLYWTNTTEKGPYSYLIVLHNDAPPTEASTKGTRCFGFTIRPVYDDRPPKRIGVFSVDADKQVSFSQGNLQYIQSTKEWLFAENQWDFIGEKNIYSGVIADKIDFFGWSTNNPQSLWGLIFTQSNVYYSGTFVDWGNNLIMGDLANTWRTLSLNEWTYLLRQRENANNLYTYANINGTNGLVLLPDKWEAIDEIPISIATDYSANTFSFSQWETLEAKGAVFLPSCGVYMGNNYNHEIAGLYWTNTPDESDETKSHCLYVTERYVNINYSGNRSTNRSVRLVHDTIVPKVEPEYVDLGLSVKWATFNVGATSPNEIGNFYAWGEIEPKDTYTVNNYKWWNKTSKETTKYCTIDSLAYGGVADGLTELQPQDDIAHILKGEHWRMPDLDECKELGNGCTWTVSTRQGQIGFEGISKINGNTIFLPVVGFRAGANLVHETLGGYWSSTLNIEKQSCAMGLYLNLETPSVGIYYNSSRQNGFLIRPVYDEVPNPCLVVKVNDTLSINLMCVEGGTFMMGSDAPDAQADEQPVHEVTLSDYYIGQTEVTQHLWKAVMGSGNNPSATKGNNLPVTDITWDETQQFVERLSELTGLRFRLPTEAEWEYAARGGQRSKGYTYAGSNDIDQVGWYNGNSSNKTHIVGQKQPNELGIYDMTGNVWEYCYDWHTPYAAQAQTNPTGAATGDKHVLRGGCYHYDPKNCTNTNRHSYYTPDKGGASTGLRIVLEP